MLNKYGVEMIRKIIKKIGVKTSVYFLYTAKPNILNPIFYLRKSHERKARRKIKEVDQGALYKFLNEVIEKSNSTGCEYSDYLRIWNELHEYQPKNILECGSGVSSVVFAYYIFKLKDPLSVNFISMEENDHYHSQIKNIFPEELKGFVTFCISERVESVYNGILGCHYKEVPDLKYDYIFIDAPTLRNFKDKSYPKAFNSDVINMILRYPEHPINGILDQRIDTLRALKKLIPAGDIKYLVTEKMSTLRGIRSDQLVKSLQINQSL